MEKKKRVFEALLFIENNPVEIERLKSVLGCELSDLETFADRLNAEYEENKHIFHVNREGSAYELNLNEVFAEEILSPYLTKKRKLSKGLMETLMIIAYKQPITRVEVEVIRGLACAHYIKQLEAGGFIEECGKKDAVGKPNLYCTTRKFLDHFSLKSLEDLPTLDEIKQSDFLEEK